MFTNKRIIKAINHVALLATISSSFHYSFANEQLDRSLTATKTQTENTSRLSTEQWNRLLQYSYEYIVKNKNSIVPEENESGFYRINIQAPDFIPKDLKINKLRIHYWPLDTAEYIRDETIHDHPKYFESLIINGGYIHSIYNINSSPIAIGAKKLNLVKINKVDSNTKEPEHLGEVYINKSKKEIMKEGQVTVMPTDVIHKISFSVPGSLSMNVVYDDQHNKDYYNIMLSKKATENDIVTSRNKVTDELKEKIVNSIEKGLLNSLFQKSSS